MNQPAQHCYEFGPFRLDPAERVVRREGEVVALTPKVFETLLVLVESSGHVVSKDELMGRVWPDTFVDEGTLTRNVSRLRSVLGENGGAPQYIETVPKRGYRFVAEVREVGDEGAVLAVHRRTRSHLVIEEEQEEDSPLPNVAPTGGSRRRRPSRVALALLALSAVLATALVYFLIERQERRVETAAGVKSIAVLPFKSLDAGGDEYLGLGMADALITKLSSLRQLIVRPTSAVRKYSSLEQDPLQAGREQRVDAVLDAGLQRNGERLRVSVRLLSVRDGSALWTYECDEQQCTDIFAAQNSISEKVAAALRLTLTGEERKRLKQRHTENQAAYQLYLKGRYFWNKRTPEGFEKAIAYFEQAINLDPRYAQAYAGLADCYMLNGGNPYARPKDSAKLMAKRALALDDTLAEAHTTLAYYEGAIEWNWLEAEGEFRRAIHLNPNYATARHWHAYHLAAMGNLEEAIAEITRAREIDPLSLIINTDVGHILYLARQYDQAITAYRKALELDPNFSTAHLRLGEAYTQQGRYEEALAELQQGRRLYRDPAFIIALGYTYAVSGHRGEAQKALAEVQALAQQSPGQWYHRALIHTGLGEKDQAFDWLRQAYDHHYGPLALYKVEPMLDSLRSDPRYTDLLRRLSLAP